MCSLCSLDESHSSDIDLCVSAALDAVKELVKVPWLTHTQIGAPATDKSKIVTEATEITQEEPSATPAEEATIPAPEVEVSLEITSDKNEISTETSQAVEEAVADTSVTVETVDASGDAPATVDDATPTGHVRTLHLRNFLKALTEITPSSSESLGSLGDLRKWNEEFGEGRNDRRRKQVWGKGRFGFIDERGLHKVEEGKVAPSSP